PATTPSPEDNKIDVAFDVVHFIDTSKTPAVSVTKTNVEKAGNIYNAANINELIEDMRDSLKKSVAVAKNSDEKPIFAGLNIAVPSGGGGKTEGNADISFNRTLYSSDIRTPALFDQLNFGFHLKKGTENLADP